MMSPIIIAQFLIALNSTAGWGKLHKKEANPQQAP
jgi:hypothetical protein